jgi:hypothetical protein
MRRIHHIRRLFGVLTGLGGALLALAAMAPAALAYPPPEPGTGTGVISPPPVVTHTVVTGGMPGWQITLIAVGAALCAAVVAVLLDRALAARHHLTHAAT